MSDTENDVPAIDDDETTEGEGTGREPTPSRKKAAPATPAAPAPAM